MGQHGDGRRRDRPELDHVHADRGKARDQRIFDHIARQAGILADHHPVAMAAALEMGAGRHADLHRQLRRHRPLVGATTNTVSAEILSAHAILPQGGYG